MQAHPVGVVGGSGYSGLELTRLLASHPFVDLRFVASDRWQDEDLGSRLGVTGEAARLRYAPLALAEELAAGCAVVFLATPAETSLDLAPHLLAQGTRVIDLSGAFRLADVDLYPRHYGFVHAKPDLLERAVYGLTEFSGPEISKASLVANPGCYATCAALPLIPLLAGGLIDPDSIIVDAASGVTGAGRRASEDLSFSEVADDFRAYRVLRHQHTPEMVQTLSRLGAEVTGLVFTPHLLPLRRGILATIYARLRPGVSAEAPQQALAEAYRDKPFVRVRSTPERVSLRGVALTNRCDLSAQSEGRQLVAVSALDNLLKGAAGQAVQNLNLLLGLPETAGLERLTGTPA